MNGARVRWAANSYTALLGATVLVSMLLAAISLTAVELQWVVFLTGVLAAATLACVSRQANARWIIARRTAQLLKARAKVATEARLRSHAEEALARMRSCVELIDEALPAMLAYVDLYGRVRYHNHAYRRWVGLDRASIDGRGVAEIVGQSAYREVEGRLREALQGRDVRYERMQVLRSGETCRVLAQYLPHLDGNGKVAGVFAILTDITRARDLGPVPALESDTTPAADDEGARLNAALQRGEFRLYSQSIEPLAPRQHASTFHEVLLRLKQEEDYHLAPGGFLPLAAELGLLPEIDRWVAGQVIDFIAAAGRHDTGVYIVTLSPETLFDEGFPEFVREHLAARAVPGRSMCFEMGEADVLAKAGPYRAFVTALEGTGCRFAVSGFGSNPLALKLLQELRVDVLKLDGGIVLNLLRSPGELARVKAINVAAHAAGMQTVAECVESAATRAALGRIGTDFAQGFGVSLPRLMSAQEHRDALSERLAEEEAA